LPVPVQLIGESKDTIVVFNHTFSGEAYLVNPGFVIKSVIFDPDLWLVSQYNSITFGVNDLPENKELLLLPNPTSDFLTVQHNLGRIYSIEIISLDGKVEPIEYDDTSDTEQKVDVSYLKSGIYMLRIGYEQGIISRKFIVNR
jgi:hypothetical protein